jgi:Mn2+/Fe2+ NRAMP family transporter
MFRASTLVIVAFGTILTYLNKRPIEIIIIAQAINGMFLPFVTVFIMYAMNSRKFLGDAVNSLAANLLGGAATLVAIFLGIRGTYAAIGRIASWF